MNDRLLGEIARKHGLDIATLQEILECERKHVHKMNRPVKGELREIVQKATQEDEIHVGE